MVKILRAIVFFFIHLLENIIHIWHFHIHKQWRHVDVYEGDE